MRRILSIALMSISLLIVASEGVAKEIYVAQSAAGVDSGANASNAHSISWLNAASNWGTGTTKVSAGDTVHLCGTISTAITIQGSGTTGNPITILFETGAKFSKNTWGTGNSIIYGSGLSYITIDGGTNGLIEATDNGTALTHQDDFYGINFNSSSNIIVKNLTISPLYVRTAGSADTLAACNGMYFHGTYSNVEILDCTLSYSGDGVTIYGGASSVLIHDNNFNHHGHAAITVGATGVITNVQIYNNTAHKSLVWSGVPNIHTNLIHAFAMAEGLEIDQLKIFNNSFSGQCGTNSTSLVFIEQNVYSPYVYNNLFTSETDITGACGNGLLFFKETINALVANNTFIRQANAGGIGISAYGTGAIIKNNLAYGMSAPVIMPYDTTGIAECDYNVYYGASIFNYGSYSQISFSDWKTATGFDGHSTTSQPSLDANYVPLSSDTVARQKGVNLSNFFTIGFTGPWDIGRSISGTDSLAAPKSFRIVN